MKQVVLIGALVGSTVGSFIPMLFGDNDLLSGWSILGGMLGGFLGIWAAVKLYNRIG